MSPEREPAQISWPDLSDEAVLELHCLITDFMVLFESRYFGQIHRYLQGRARDSCSQPEFVQPDLFRSLDPDEPPF